MRPKATAADDATSASASLSRSIRRSTALASRRTPSELIAPTRSLPWSLPSTPRNASLAAGSGIASRAMRAHEASCLSATSGASAGTASLLPQMANCLQAIAFSCGIAPDCSTAISSRWSFLASVFLSAALAAAEASIVTRTTTPAKYRTLDIMILRVFTTRNPEREVLQPPRLANRFPAQPIGLFVADEHVVLGIVFKLAVQEDRDVRGVASDVRLAGHLGIHSRLSP